MNKKSLLLIALIALAFFVNFASAHHYNNYNRDYDWRVYNQYLEDRIPHNRMYNYFKYGSPWQGDVVYDLTYSYPPYYSIPRYVEKPRNDYGRHHRYALHNYRNYDSGYYDDVYRYRNLDRRNYRYLDDCGYESGYYGDCY